MTLREAFTINPGEIISLVGGGGKTTLMFALAHELVATGKCVVTTTTTKILPPLPSQTPLLLLDTDEEDLIRLLLHNIEEYRHISVASEKLTSGKLTGISTELVGRLAELNQVSYIIVEADGAAQKPLKAPNATEPVIPGNTTLVIPIVGIDAIGCRLTEENVFRPETVANLLGLSSGEIITAEAIAFLITHHQGIIKGSPGRARIIPFINKVDLDNGLAKAKEVASKILAISHPQIEQVVLGQAQSPQPVTKVISQHIE
jgi:probable selenium-dependent hydroxylase accessory protein YqeC